jgi:gamma-glutamyltranspeptidase
MEGKEMTWLWKACGVGGDGFMVAINSMHDSTRFGNMEEVAYSCKEATKAMNTKHQHFVFHIL